MYLTDTFEGLADIFMTMDSDSLIQEVFCAIQNFFCNAMCTLSVGLQLLCASNFKHDVFQVTIFAVENRGQ